ncbi:MAG: hypothetical protein ACFB00_08410 [Parvularculaceae bacterium]
MTNRQTSTGARPLLAAIIVVFGLIQPVAASPDAAAYEAFADGRYESAVDIAANAGGAENLALAARAHNAVAYFEADRKAARRAARAALEEAEAAIELDPQLPEAHLQSAIALAVFGAKAGPLRSFVGNVAGRSRRSIDAALAIDPDNPWALSTSAAWRLEVHRRGGGLVYDADPDLGFKEFERARELAPDNVAVAYECALRLLASERAAWRGVAREALNVAVEGAPETAFEREIQARARGLKAARDRDPMSLAAFIDAAA